MSWSYSVDQVGPIPKEYKHFLNIKELAIRKDFGSQRYTSTHLLFCRGNGIVSILGIETFGKNAVVCGRSKNVGMPTAMLLHADGIGETNAGNEHIIYLIISYDHNMLFYVDHRKRKCFNGNKCVSGVGGWWLSIMIHVWPNLYFSNVTRCRYHQYE